MLHRLARLLGVPYREVRADLAARRDDVLTPITVKENVLMGAYIRRRDRDFLKSRYEEIAELFPVVEERDDDDGPPSKPTG